jgi:hypothetical protein
LWAFVGAGEFQAYHWAWWRSIWFVVMGPTVLVPTRSLCRDILGPPEDTPSGRMMARLANPETGLILPLYRELMLTHWIRVALVTGYGLLAFWMLLRSASATRAPA